MKKQKFQHSGLIRNFLSTISCNKIYSILVDDYDKEKVLQPENRKIFQSLRFYYQKFTTVNSNKMFLSSYVFTGDFGWVLAGEYVSNRAVLQ